MKKTRKFAALLAALMCVSGMGAMNAFAEGQTVNNTTPNSILNLANETEGTVSDTTKVASASLGYNRTDSSTDSYEAAAVWNISVSTDALTWTVTRTGTKTHTLTWDSSSRTYSDTYSDGGSGDNFTYSLDTTPQSITLTSSCNFEVTPNVSIGGPTLGDTDAVTSFEWSTAENGTFTSGTGSLSDMTASSTDAIVWFKPVAVGDQATLKTLYDDSASRSVAAHAYFTFTKGTMFNFEDKTVTENNG